MPVPGLVKSSRPLSSASSSSSELATWPSKEKRLVLTSVVELESSIEIVGLAASA